MKIPPELLWIIPSIFGSIAGELHRSIRGRHLDIQVPYFLSKVFIGIFSGFVFATFLSRFGEGDTNMLILAASLGSFFGSESVKYVYFKVTGKDPREND